jgi:hypothetical protein
MPERHLTGIVIIHDRPLEARRATLDIPFLSRLARSVQNVRDRASRAGRDRPRSPYCRLSRVARNLPRLCGSRRPVDDAQLWYGALSDMLDSRSGYHRNARKQSERGVPPTLIVSVNDDIASTLPGRGRVAEAARSGPMLHSSRGGDDRSHEAVRRPGESYNRGLSRLRRVASHGNRRAVEGQSRGNKIGVALGLGAEHQYRLFS